MIELIASTLGALSLLISAIAVWISRRSDRRMEALSNLEFQEKLAVMAHHLKSVREDKSSLRAEQVQSDLAAAGSLMNFASKKNQEKLIRDYTIPILREYLSSNMGQETAITVREVIDTALSFGIESSELENLRQRMRGFGQRPNVVS